MAGKRHEPLQSGHRRKGAGETACLHVSLSADDPARAAGLISTFPACQALPFAPFPGSPIAFTGQDDRGAIEVDPLAHRLTIGP